MNWNMSSRDYNKSQHTFESTKPIRYHMLDSACLYQSRLGPFDVTASNALRSEPTRLNYVDHPSTELFGTAPFKGRNDGPVDVESSLIHGNQFFLSECDRAMVAEHDYFHNRVQLPFPMQPHDVEPQYAVSTRAEYRNTQLNSA
jgi:hypothetical protein